MKTVCEDIRINDTLNPNLWEDNELKEEVKEKLLDIVDNFLDILKQDKINIDVVDVRFLGSNANYNYTDKSDIDLHIVADFGNVPCEQNVMPQLYNAYKSIFNSKYDININGCDVEIYVEDVNQPAKSNGVYSLFTGWIKEPVRSNIPNIDWEEFEKQFDEWEDRYFDVVGEHTSLEEKVIYRGESGYNYSDKFDNYAGLFFHGDEDSEYLVPYGKSDYGTLVKYELDDDANIYNGESSRDYCEQNKSLWNKKDQVLTNFIFGKNSTIEPLSLKTIFDKELYLRDNPDIQFACTQYIARKDLESKGYDGAHWSYEDELYSEQYQIWNKDVLERLGEIELEESLSQEVDSEGNPLTPEQVEFFKNSKVRDSQGRLLVVYHGTDAEFDTFKKGDIGFHFGTEAQARDIVANKSKKNIGKYYLNITSPLIIDKDLGVWDAYPIASFICSNNFYNGKFKKYLPKFLESLNGLDDVIDEITDFQYDDLNDADYTLEDAIKCITDYFDLDDQLDYDDWGNQLVRNVLVQEGYDGINYKNVFEDFGSGDRSYIVFNPNQIKSIDNKNPSSSNNINEDVELLEKVTEKDILILGDDFEKDGVDIKALCQGYNDPHIQMRRDYCGWINGSFHHYLSKKLNPEVYRNVDITKGGFKVDNYKLCDVKDAKCFKQDYVDAILNCPTTNKDNLYDRKNVFWFFNDYLVNNYPEVAQTWLYIPHWYLKYKDTIIDAASRMFKKGLNKPISKDNYLTLEEYLKIPFLTIEKVKGKQIKEDLDNEEEIYDDLDKTFGQENVYMWSTYILPNGHFLNPENNKDEDFLSNLEYEHNDFFNYLNDKYTLDYSVFDNCMKMNITWPYIHIPKNKWTYEQKQAFRKILDRKDLFEPTDAYEIASMGFKNAYDTKEPLIIYTHKGNQKLFDLSIYSTEDIIREIDKFYSSGKFDEFDESLNEDYDYDKIYQIKELYKKAYDELIDNSTRLHRYREWASNSNNDYKEYIYNDLKNNKKDSALNLWYNHYRLMTGNYDLSYEDFLNTPITLYRATNVKEDEDSNNSFFSYAQNKSDAERFLSQVQNLYGSRTGEIKELQIKPKDTFGMLPSDENEIIVPNNSYQKRIDDIESIVNEVIDYANKSNVELPYDRDELLDLFKTEGRNTNDFKNQIIKYVDKRKDELKEAKFKNLVKLDNDEYLYKDKVKIGYNKKGKYYFVIEPDNLNWMYSQTLKDLIFSLDRELKESLKESNDYGYHAGDLGKSERREQQTGGRGTGHFGTGTYFVGNPDRIKGYNDYQYGKGEAPHHIVDFSSYNLYKPSNNNYGYKLHDALANINNGYKYFTKNAKDYDYFIDKGIDANNSGDFRVEDIPEIVEHLNNLLGSYDHIDLPTNINFNTIEQEEEDYSDKLYDELKPKYEGTMELWDIIEDELMKVDKFKAFREIVKEVRECIEYELTPNIIRRYKDHKNIISNLVIALEGRHSKDQVIQALEEVNKHLDEKQGDSLSTIFMKALGYEGIDVRHLQDDGDWAGLDNTTYGSVIYDLKPETIVEDIDNSNLKGYNLYEELNNLDKIEFFEDEQIGCPVEEFLNSIEDKKLKAKTIRNIKILNEKGSELTKPLVDYVDDGIYELRTQQSNNITRIFYFFIFGGKIIMTNGYIKKTQKLNKDEFAKAKKYRDIYSRKKVGEK